MDKTLIRFWILSEEIQYQDIWKRLWLIHDSYCVKWWRMNNAEKWAINDSHIWIKNSWLSREEWDEDLHFEELLKIFNPLKKELGELKDDGCDFQLDIILYTHNANPWVYIERKYSDFFSEIWVAINIDIYYMWEESDD